MKVFSFKKYSLLLLSLFGGLGGCINDDVPTGSSQVAQGDPDGNVVFNLIVPNSGSSLTKSTETSGDYETGDDGEYSVSNVTVYLFDATTGAFRYSFKFGTSYSDPLTIKNQYGQELVQYNTVRMKVEEEGTYNIYAIANAESKQFENETKFFEETYTISYENGGVSQMPKGRFIMTTRADNSGYYSDYKDQNRDVYLKNVGPNERPKEVNLVLERVLAKVQVGTKKSVYNLTDPNDPNAEYAQVELTNYFPINLPTEFYLFRHVNQFSSFPETIPDFTIPDNFGVVKDQNENGYVVDPYFFKKKVEGAASFNNNTDGYYAYPLGNAVSAENWSPVPTVGDSNLSSSFSSFYCLENCMFKTAQKNAYSTGVHFRAKITPKRIIGSENPDTIYYANYTFYDWNTLSSKINVSGLNKDSDDTALARIGVKRFIKDTSDVNQPKYYCYYNYWIRHLDNNKPNEMGVMEFAVVRNNIYRLKITDISGLGSGSPEIDPGKDDETEVLLNMNINVLPWIVRYQGGNGGVTL